MLGRSIVNFETAADWGVKQQVYVLDNNKKKNTLEIFIFFAAAQNLFTSLCMRKQQFGFRPGPTQTGLVSHRSRQEA